MGVRAAFVAEKQHIYRAAGDKLLRLLFFEKECRIIYVDD